VYQPACSVRIGNTGSLDESCQCKRVFGLKFVSRPCVRKKRLEQIGNHFLGSVFNTEMQQPRRLVRRQVEWRLLQPKKTARRCGSAKKQHASRAAHAAWVYTRSDAVAGQVHLQRPRAACLYTGLGGGGTKKPPPATPAAPRSKFDRGPIPIRSDLALYVAHTAPDRSRRG
jgi:hypothetical protein